MTKPQEILTPSLTEFVAEIVELTKKGYRIHLEPQMASWQYYCEMVQEDAPEVVVAVAPAEPKPQRGPKPKVKAAAEESAKA